MEMVTNKFVAIKHHVKNGTPEDVDFEFKTEPFALSNEPGETDVIVKTLFLSIDAYMFNRMKDQSSLKMYQRSIPFRPGKAIEGYGVGKVVVSGDPKFKKDDLVGGFLSWGDYTRIKYCGANAELYKLDTIHTMGLPLSYQAGGILGRSTGLAAYAGFFEVCQPKRGEKVLVSAASASVGNIAGQYAKLFGCYVVGSAGSQEEVKLLKERLGFDEAFNYQEETDLRSALTRYFPEGIDIYFDNVGGEMLEAAVANMNFLGRVAVCGDVSEYTDENKCADLSMLDVVFKRITIRRFIAVDHMDVLDEFLSTTAGYIREGKMQVLQDIYYGLESLPPVFLGLFRGNNVGKKIVNLQKYANRQRERET